MLRNHIYLAMTAALLLCATPARSMELGEIDVGSRLGEAFSAKVPLRLEAGESISALNVEVAAAGDYQTLNVHRHPVLNLIRTDIIRNRLTNWIELTSHSPVNTPVFFLVLKVSYGHATHFKRYSVFLDLPDGKHSGKKVASTATETARDDPPPSTYLSLDASLSAEEHPADAEPAASFTPFDGWARTSSYGPVMHGDIIYIIADRLRVDRRYTIRQVMVALLEKNRSSFSEGNINLPIAGSHLDVPTAEEVEKYSYEEALSIIRDHGQLWEELIKQPRYAAIAEAQRNRYRRRDADATSTR